MAEGLASILGRPSQLVDAAQRFMELPETERASLTEHTPSACFNDLTDCIAAVCGDSTSRTAAAKHRPPFYEAVRPHARTLGDTWNAMKGPMTYFVVDTLRDVFCQEPPTAAVAVTVATSQPVLVTKPVAATSCLPTAAARENAWTILSELLMGGLLVYLFRGQIPQFNTPSGVMGTSPYGSLDQGTVL